MSGQHVLTLQGVTKDFAGLRALDNVSLRLSEGEILGLIGPNGSGKTTLINVVTGLLPATSGKISANLVDITRMPAFRIARTGIARTFQTIRLFRELTVLENVQVAGVSMGLSRLDARRRAESVLEELALSPWRLQRAG
ncbi:MAG TPA: ATP-binding cassette domain-containing protein, partial [Spirochaetia bacterium]|nr:ATP-binding cassette domain-containing protein [Spirochaetia bacterium]